MNKRKHYTIYNDEPTNEQRIADLVSILGYDEVLRLLAENMQHNAKLYCYKSTGLAAQLVRSVAEVLDHYLEEPKEEK